eukprot:56302-Pelagomonas_calceolata.AAC.2
MAYISVPAYKGSLVEEKGCLYQTSPICRTGAKKHETQPQHLGVPCARGCLAHLGVRKVRGNGCRECGTRCGAESTPNHKPRTLAGPEWREVCNDTSSLMNYEKLGPCVPAGAGSLDH